MPQIDQGNVNIAVPIDVPFTELNRLMEAQLKGKTFPDDGKSPGQVTVLAASLSASGDRLLVSLRVKAKENKSWFGLGAEATVHIWGKPTLDRDNQIMRLTDISLDVQSEAAFGLLGTAARAAIPYLQSALQKNAVVDLKPFAASARDSIEAALTEFKKPVDGVEVEAGGRRRQARRRRVRFQDLARDRRGAWHRARAGAQDCDVAETKDKVRTLKFKHLVGARKNRSRYGPRVWRYRSAVGSSITGFDKTPSPSTSTSQTSPGRMWSWPATMTLPTGFSGCSPGRSGKAPGEPETITSPGCSV